MSLLINDNLIEVHLFGELMGVLFWDKKTNTTTFEYNKKYSKPSIVSAPILMPFPTKTQAIYGPFYYGLGDAFEGLPPMIADSLPDAYGKQVITMYLKENGLEEVITPLRLLSYVGTRGMGALEFIPNFRSEEHQQGMIETDLTLLSKLSNAIIDNTDGNFKVPKHKLQQIFQVGSSAGGAKAKAIISYNFKTNEFAYSYKHQPDFTPIMVKFDSLDQAGNSYDNGRVEYIYHKMAVKSGINMTECGYFKDGDQSHFYTRRFDRTRTGEKLHLQTLAAVSGKNPRELHDYDLVFKTILKLGLTYKDLEQQFRRMVFNFYAANDDCHLKNIAFLMDTNGKWTLSPGYDITFPYDYNKVWKRTQPISINGKIKATEITDEDFLLIAKEYGIKRAQQILNEIREVILGFEKMAIKYNLPENKFRAIKSHFRI
jgi:serine/threonine-protein kinase HipA